MLGVESLKGQRTSVQNDVTLRIDSVLYDVDSSLNINMKTKRMLIKVKSHSVKIDIRPVIMFISGINN